MHDIHLEKQRLHMPHDDEQVSLRANRKPQQRPKGVGAGCSE